MRGTSQDNEGKLKAYLQGRPGTYENGTFKNGMYRKHPKGSKPGVVAVGYQKYIITVKSDYLEDMKQIAFVRGIQIKEAFEEAIEAYLKASELVKPNTPPR